MEIRKEKNVYLKTLIKLYTNKSDIFARLNFKNKSVNKIMEK
jgi:hypothetical protein